MRGAPFPSPPLPVAPRTRTHHVEGEGQAEQEEPQVEVQRVDQRGLVRVVEPAAAQRRPRALPEDLQRLRPHGEAGPGPRRPRPAPRAPRARPSPRPPREGRGRGTRNRSPTTLCGRTAGSARAASAGPPPSCRAAPRLPSQSPTPDRGAAAAACTRLPARRPAPQPRARRRSCRPRGRKDAAERGHAPEARWPRPGLRGSAPSSAGPRGRAAPGRTEREATPPYGLKPRPSVLELRPLGLAAPRESKVTPAPPPRLCGSAHLGFVLWLRPLGYAATPLGQPVCHPPPPAGGARRLGERTDCKATPPRLHGSAPSAPSPRPLAQPAPLGSRAPPPRFPGSAPRRLAPPPLLRGSAPRSTRSPRGPGERLLPTADGSAQLFEARLGIWVGRCTAG